MLLIALAMLLGAVALGPEASARPETIRPGIAYYDEDYEVNAGVPDLVGEKNYEEVYRNYAYFEARYDDRHRVVTFVAYKRGDMVWRVRIDYGPNGKITRLTVTDDQDQPIPLPEP